MRSFFFLSSVLLMVLGVNKDHCFALDCNSIRIAYLNTNDNRNASGIPDIPKPFLTRAKANGYTHILVEFYLDNAYNNPNTWDDGIYCSGLSKNHARRYHNGRLYGIIQNSFEKVVEEGMVMIPLFNVGALSLSWSSVNNPNIEYYANTGSHASMATIVPGQTKGLRKTFKEILKVISAAYTDTRNNHPSLSLPVEIPYIQLGYSEAYRWDANTNYWGGLSYGTSPNEIAWMNTNHAEIEDLVVASIQERFEDMSNIGDPAFANTKLMIYTDLYDPEFGVPWTGELPIPDVVTKAKNAGLNHDLIFVQWQYEAKAQDGSEYDVQKALSYFMSNGFDVIPMSIITNGNDMIQAAKSIPHLVNTVKVSKMLNTAGLPGKIIGFASAHWDGPDFPGSVGYDNDICWNAMEYLAYGNQITRPKTKFSRIPQATINGMITQPLLISQTEVTQGDYYAITGKFPFNNYATGNLNMPAENLTFYDAILYCNSRSNIEGLKPVYSYDTPLTTDFSDDNCTILRNLTADTSKNGYRLPSPEEWERAYMAGTTTSYYWGSSIYTPDNCWGSDNSGGTTHPVGQKKANAFGLHDMAGNVEEMTCTYDSTLLEGFAGGCFVNSMTTRIEHNSNILVENMGPVRWLGFRVVRNARTPTTAHISM